MVSPPVARAQQGQQQAIVEYPQKNIVMVGAWLLETSSSEASKAIRLEQTHQTSTLI
jgi:hypothetical protein